MAIFGQYTATYANQLENQPTTGQTHSTLHFFPVICPLEEAKIIIDILVQVVDDRRGEIWRTDTIEYKISLEQREIVPGKVVSELN